MKHLSAIVCLCLATLIAAPAGADQPHRLLPESLNLEVVEGSSIPDDCQYPASIRDAARFEIACVTMPADAADQINAEYIGQLGAQGWRQGDYIMGGMAAVRTDENHCQRVLDIFPSAFPPGQTPESDVAVLWLALERTPRCHQSEAP